MKPVNAVATKTIKQIQFIKRGKAMAAIPKIELDPTLEAMDRETESLSANKPRRVPSLACSTIGEPCERKTWFAWRMAKTETFSAESLYRFDDGFNVEAVTASRLARVPNIKIRTVNPNTGYQFALSLVDSHLQGRVDGLIDGLIQAPTTTHVWEAKATNESAFNSLKKAKIEHGENDALKAWNLSYYSQAVLYMHALNLSSHYLTCSTPGARSTISVMTNADPLYAQSLIEKATRIKESAHVPIGLSTDPTWYGCKFCTFHSLCFENKIADVQCRSCLHSTPVEAGQWHCAKFNQNVPDHFQVQGCDNHLFIPSLVPFAKAVDADEVENSITYEKSDGVTFKNGKEYYTSKEIQAVQDFNALGDKSVDTIKSVFGAEVVA